MAAKEPTLTDELEEEEAEEEVEVVEGEVIDPARHIVPYNEKDLVALSKLSEAQQRAYGLLLTSEQVEFLLQRTPPHEIKKVPGRGGGLYPYVSIGYVIERLNLVFGFLWSTQRLSVVREGDQILYEGRLVVKTKDGVEIISKEDFGVADIKFRKDSNKVPVSLGDDYKAAVSDFIKRAARQLGIGNDLVADEDRRVAEEVTSALPQDNRSPDALKAATIKAGTVVMGWDKESVAGQVAAMSRVEGKQFVDLPRETQLRIAHWFEEGASMVSGEKSYMERKIAAYVGGDQRPQQNQAPAKPKMGPGPRK